MQKLGVSDIPSLVKLAIRYGLTELEGAARRTAKG